ncbi:sigma-70 region 4 domain-containing protein, partial [Luteimonas sp. SJ-92]|nr:sigma-70 region 4 domain-containing protein [Luteimonas salinisoli]
MPPSSVTDSAAGSAAVSAFLRGVERRAAVFAQLQAGDAAAGDAALAAAMAAFRDAAARTQFGDWPRRFWAQLLAARPLRGAAATERWPPQFAALAQLGHGPRAALLLRLVANVSEADAAAVLGISRPTYRLALRRALPRDGEGRADTAS